MMGGMTSMDDKARSDGTIYGEEILAWTAPEYANHAKSERWTMVAGVFAVSLIAYGLISAQYTMAIAFALLAAVYHLVHNHPEREITIRVTGLGLVVAGQFYPYAEISDFWIVYDPPAVSKLYIRPRKRLGHDLAIELVDQDPQLVRSILETQVHEIVGKTESMTQRMARLLNL